MREAKEKYYSQFEIELSLKIIELEQQKAELIDVMERIRGLCKSKAVNNNIDQIFLIADIALNKLQKE
jgi:hypothetical protein